jgi:hypothetical protein
MLHSPFPHARLKEGRRVRSLLGVLRRERHPQQGAHRFRLHLTRQRTVRAKRCPRVFGGLGRRRQRILLRYALWIAILEDPSVSVWYAHTGLQHDDVGLQ